MFSKLGVQFLGLGYCIRTKYGMTYPVSCTADCYVMVITLFIKKVAVVRPNFGGSGPPTPSVCALELLDLLWSKVLLMMIVTISLNYWRFFRYLNTVVSTRSVHVSISCTVELVSIYLLFWWYVSSVNVCLEVEQYSVVIRSSLLQETFLRSYTFSRIHIQGKESSSPDLQSMCRS